MHFSHKLMQNNFVKSDYLAVIKHLNKKIKIAQWFEDNLAKSGPDPYSNQRRLLQYEPFIDFNFI